MTWVKLDDQFADHPKLRSVGALGMALQVSAICYSARHLTDGFISFAVAKSLVRQLATPWSDSNGVEWSPDVGSGMVGKRADEFPWEQAMLQAGLWELEPHGYRIHDFGDFNPSKADVLASRAEIVAKRQEAGRLGGLARAANARSKQTPSKPPSKEQATANQNSSPDPDPDPDPKSDQIPPVGPPAAPPTEPPAPGGAPKAKRVRERTACPASTDATAASFADRWGLPASDPEFAAFLDNHRGKGSLMADWSAAWRTWLRYRAKFDRRQPPSSTRQRLGIQPPAPPGEECWSSDGPGAFDPGGVFGPPLEAKS